MLQTSPPSGEHTGAQHQESEPWQASAPSLSPFPTTNLEMVLASVMRLQSQRGLTSNLTESHQAHLPRSAPSMAQTAVTRTDQIMEIGLSGAGERGARHRHKPYADPFHRDTRPHTQTPSTDTPTHIHTDPFHRETHAHTETQPTQTPSRERHTPIHRAQFKIELNIQIITKTSGFSFNMQMLLAT